MNRPGWIKWDTSILSNPSYTYLQIKYGLDFEGLRTWLMQQLAVSHTGKIQLDTRVYTCIGSLYRRSREQLEEIIDAMIEFGLFKKDEEGVYHEGLLGEIQGWNEKQKAISDIKRRAVSARWEKVKQKAQNDVDTQGYTCIQSDTDVLRIDKNRIDKSINNINTYIPAEPEPVKKAKKTKAKVEPKGPCGQRDETEPYGYENNVYLKAEEVDQLKQKYGSVLVDRKINEMSQAIANGLKYAVTYKNHKTALMNWCDREAARFPQKPTKTFDSLGKPVVEPQATAPRYMTHFERQLEAVKQMQAEFAAEEALNQ